MIKQYGQKQLGEEMVCLIFIFSHYSLSSKEVREGTEAAAIEEYCLLSLSSYIAHPILSTSESPCRWWHSLRKPFANLPGQSHWGIFSVKILSSQIFLHLCQAVKNKKQKSKPHRTLSLLLEMGLKQMLEGTCFIVEDWPWTPSLSISTPFSIGVTIMHHQTHFMQCWFNLPELCIS